MRWIYGCRIFFFIFFGVLFCLASAVPSRRPSPGPTCGGEIATPICSCDTQEKPAIVRRLNPAQQWERSKFHSERRRLSSGAGPGGLQPVASLGRAGVSRASPWRVAGAFLASMTETGSWAPQVAGAGCGQKETPCDLAPAACCTAPAACCGAPVSHRKMCPYIRQLRRCELTNPAPARFRSGCTPLARAAAGARTSSALGGTSPAPSSPSPGPRQPHPLTLHPRLLVSYPNPKKKRNAVISQPTPLPHRAPYCIVRSGLSFSLCPFLFALNSFFVFFYLCLVSQTGVRK